MGHPIDYLRKHIDLPPEVEANLRSIMQETTFKRGDTLSTQNDMRANNFYILKGGARVYYTKLGKEHTYSFAFDDEFVSMSHFLLDSSEHELVIEFIEPTTVIFIPIFDARGVMESRGVIPSVEVAMMVIAALHEHSKQLEERIHILQSASAPERYRWLINRYPRILERATITQIASYLGVTKETLYRIRAGRY